MDTLDSEARLSEMDESSLSNPPSSESDSSDSSESGGEAGREQNGEEREDEEDDDDDEDDEDDDEGQDQASEQQTEWLATTRVRRSNAGNRMKSMLANEEPDSDLELLFAEDEDDAGFLDAEEHASDEQMDSSSSDDDDNADDTNAGDDLEGERELERQAREKRAAQRKRKAQSAIPAKFRKRVRIDATASSDTSTPAPRRPAPAPAFAPRPRKKSERLSWLPTPADLPTRASSRETTRLSKEQLHQQMVEREEKRHKQMVQMQKKAARMEALKKPPMTQEDRLREAAIVEERNSKSLNRWEVAEKQREEERRAKLAALHQRTLSGPVITLWSGIGEARRAVVEEEKPKKKRERTDKAKNKATNDANKTVPGKEAPGSGIVDGDTQNDTHSTTPLKPSQSGSAARLPDPAPSGAAAAAAAASEAKQLKLPVRQDTAETHRNDESTPSGPADENSRPRLMAMPPGPSPPPLNRTGYAHPPESTGKPSRVLAAPILAPPPSMNVDFDPNQAPKSNVLAPPNTSPLVSRPALPLTQMQSQESLAKHPPTTTARFLPPPDVDEMQGVKHENVPVEGSTTDEVHRSEPTSQQATETSADLATTTRNAIIFQNFDENAIKEKSIQTQILFGRGMNKLSKPPPVSICAITNLPARYRDPKTGLAYHNAYAYREIQRLSRGEHRWSKILNAWVGSGKVAARGVPERFLNPDAPRRTVAAAAAAAAAGEEKQEEEGKKKQPTKSAAQGHGGAAEAKKTAGGQEQAEKKKKTDSPKKSTKPPACDGATAAAVAKPVPAK